MPIRKKDYPPNWKEISIQIRTEAGWKCEWCGVPNKAVIERLPSGKFKQIDWINETDGTIVASNQLNFKRLRYHGLTRVVLTVAHLDRNTKNNQIDNLAALCQKCHLGHDIIQHIQNRRYGRHHTEEHQLKLCLEIL